MEVIDEFPAFQATIRRTAVRRIAVDIFHLLASSMIRVQHFHAQHERATDRPPSFVDLALSALPQEQSDVASVEAHSPPQAGAGRAASTAADAVGAAGRRMALRLGSQTLLRGGLSFLVRRSGRDGGEAAAGEEAGGEEDGGEEDGGEEDGEAGAAAGKAAPRLVSFADPPAPQEGAGPGASDKPEAADPTEKADKAERGSHRGGSHRDSVLGGTVRGMFTPTRERAKNGAGRPSGSDSEPSPQQGSGVHFKHVTRAHEMDRREVAPARGPRTAGRAAAGAWPPRVPLPRPTAASPPPPEPAQAQSRAPHRRGP